MGHDVIYFVKHETKGKRGYTENELFSKMEFLINNIYEFVRHIFQQIIGIPMGINCVPLLTDLSLYSHEAEFIQKLIKEQKTEEVNDFNLTFRYIDGVLSINNPHFANWIPLIYLQRT